MNKINQYRSNNIEMRFPVTFKASSIPDRVMNWTKNTSFDFNPNYLNVSYLQANTSA